MSDYPDDWPGFAPSENMLDHGSDRFDYIEIEGPEWVPPPSWLTADWMPCPDCRANAFLKWLGDRWHITIAHDETCPSLEAAEKRGFR